MQVGSLNSSVPTPGTSTGSDDTALRAEDFSQVLQNAFYGNARATANTVGNAADAPLQDSRNDQASRPADPRRDPQPDPPHSDERHDRTDQYGVSYPSST